MGTGIIQRSLAAGEIAPALHARADLAKYSQGLRVCHNFMVRREGGVSNRAGTRFIAAAKTPDAGTRIHAFKGPTVDENYLVEMGAGYLRFYKDGAAIRLTNVPAFDDTADYNLGNLVSLDGVNYYCTRETVAEANAERLVVFSFDSGMVVHPIVDPNPYPTVESITAEDAGTALRFTYPSFTGASAFAWFNAASAADRTHYADGQSVTDAALLAPKVRVPAGTPITSAAVYIVTANWDASRSINSGGKNTSAFALVLDSTKLRLGTPAVGSWFRVTQDDGTPLTRADWASVGTPSWATVQGIIVQVTTPNGTTAQIDLDDLFLSETIAGVRPPTPAPPDAEYWGAMSGDYLEIPTDYWPLDALPRWEQNGNTVVLTHPVHPPRELVYQDETHWIYRLAATTPSLAAPANVAGSTTGTGTLTYRYVVSAAKKDSFEESYPSAVITLTSCAEPSATAPHQLTWDGVVDEDANLPAEYYVYLDPDGNGTFGYVGASSNGVCAFNYTGAVPIDFESTPVQAREVFNVAGDYPAVCGHYQQRRWFANTGLNPDTMWGSKTGFATNFGITSPLQDDDAVTLRISGNNNQAVSWLVGCAAGLAVLTGGGEWALTGGSGPGTPITPSSLDIRQQTYNGVSETVRPVVVGNTIVYLQARGSVLRDLQFNQQVQGLAGRDLTVWASHLFERQTITALDYQQVPNTIIWCVRKDGTLLGLTYLPDQDVWGWHRHDTMNGVFEDVAVVPEDDEDVLYVLVAPIINNTVVRYIERLERREIRDAYLNLDSFFVDSGLTYQGAPATVISGLDHLEGQVVAVVADGTVVYNGDATRTRAVDFTVTDGAITLPAPASLVHVGLPIVSEIETLDLDLPYSQGMRSKKKRIASLILLLERSVRAFLAGPDATHLRACAIPAWNNSSGLYTGQCELAVEAQYDPYGRTFIRLTEPVPLTILGLIPDVDITT